MFSSENKEKILMIGNDAMLTYLIKRYAEKCGLTLENTTRIPSLAEIFQLNPSSIIFSSLTALREAQSQIRNLVDLEIQILVCSGIGEEAAAREIGADFCLLHPFTYDDFCKVISSNQHL